MEVWQELRARVALPSITESYPHADDRIQVMLFFEYTFFKHCSFPKTIRSYITASGSFHIHTPHLGNFVNQQKENCMKNNIFKIIIFFLALVSLGACDDGCEDYLDQYDDVLYGINQVIHYHQHEDKIQ